MIRGPRVADILYQVISIHNENTKGTNHARSAFAKKNPLASYSYVSTLISHSGVIPALFDSPVPVCQCNLYRTARSFGIYSDHRGDRKRWGHPAASLSRAAATTAADRRHLVKLHHDCSINESGDRPSISLRIRAALHSMSDRTVMEPDRLDASTVETRPSRSAGTGRPETTEGGGKRR